ncbi:MAG: GAF domain-containing protein [Acidimicrobiales bacterium]
MIPPDATARDPTAALRNPERLAVLRALAVVDAPEEPFDRRTRLVARILEAPVAFVVFLDAERQIVKSATGLPEPWGRARDLPIDWGFGRLAVADARPLVVEDLRRSDDLARNPIVTELGAVAYLGVPLVDKAGNVLGAICALDVRPRAWAEAHVELLAAFAESLMSQVELEMELERHQRLVASGTRAAGREHLRALAEASMLASSTTSVGDRLRVIAQQARDLIGTNAALISVPTNDGAGHEARSISISEHDDAGHEPVAADAISVELVARDGRQLGVLRVSDKVDGTAFTEEDQAVLDQLGRTSGSPAASRWTRRSSAGRSRACEAGGGGARNPW